MTVTEPPPLLDRELGQLLDSVGKLQDEENRLAEQRGAIETDQQSRQRTIEDATQALGKLSEDLKAWSEQLTTARISLGQVQEKQLASQQAVARQTAAKAKARKRIPNGAGDRYRQYRGHHRDQDAIHEKPREGAVPEDVIEIR